MSADRTQPRHQKNVVPIKSKIRETKTIGAERWLNNDRLKAAFILLVTLIVYFPAMWSGFIWDDALFLTANEWIKSPGGLLTFWFKPNLVEYIPVTFTSFWLEWRLWGIHAAGYHITNILLHALGAILFWRVLRRLNIPGAWLAGMIFAVHPVAVESVAWIAERKNTLSLVFYLFSTLSYLRFDDQEHQRSRGWYWLSLATFVGALLSKTSVVMLPIILLGCVWWRRNRITYKDLSRSLPFFAASLVLGVLTIYQQWNSQHHGSAIATDSFLVRTLGGSWAIWFYLSKVFWPINLCMIYPRWEIEPVRWATYVPGLLWGAGLYVCWKSRRTWGRAPLFALGYFSVSLIPVCGLIRMSFLYYSRVADHLQYLAILGVIALVAGAFTAWWQNRGHWKHSYPLGACVVFLLSSLTWKQAATYENEGTLWAYTLSINPGAWVAHTQLGDALLKRGKYDGAIEHYRAALAIKPEHSNTHNNLGNLLAMAGKTQEAIVHFQQAIKYNPKLLAARNNLGLQLVLCKQYEEAQRQFREALSIDPDSAAAHFGMGNVFFYQTNLPEALVHYEASVRLQPNWPEAQYNAGVVAGMIGDRPNAIHHLKEAVRLRPDYNEAAKELAELGKRTGD